VLLEPSALPQEPPHLLFALLVLIKPWLILVPFLVSLVHLVTPHSGLSPLHSPNVLRVLRPVVAASSQENPMCPKTTQQELWGVWWVLWLSSLPASSSTPAIITKSWLCGSREKKKLRRSSPNHEMKPKFLKNRRRLYHQAHARHARAQRWLILLRSKKAMMSLGVKS
jgi:hypothetical protein